MNLFVGLMSGTSMDGVDVALIDVDTHRLIHALTYPWPEQCLDQMQDVVSKGVITLETLGYLDRKVALVFSQAVNTLLDNTHIQPAMISAIGSHGQTLYHDTQHSLSSTIQIGCPHTIAEETKCTVVADFRSRDIACHGQGAPLAPLYHRELFKNEPRDIAIVNIGGISNISLMRPDGLVSGWDIGPGNCLMDLWSRKYLGKPFDKSGQWAESGTLIEPLLSQMLADSFFSLPTPKSLDKQYFSEEWLQSFLKEQSYHPQDVQNTLSHLTIKSIASYIKEESWVKRLYICGGGVYNDYLLNELNNVLSGVDVASIETQGISAAYLEAMMCAWMAQQCLLQNNLDTMNITGASKPMVCGVVYPYGAF